MKEAKIRTEKNTDWLGTFKSLFGSSISTIDSESEFDKWQKAHAKDIAEKMQIFHSVVTTGTVIVIIITTCMNYFIITK